jgi:hypothetical protein
MFFFVGRDATADALARIWRSQALEALCSNARVALTGSPGASVQRPPFFFFEPVRERLYVVQRNRDGADLLAIDAAEDEARKIATWNGEAFGVQATVDGVWVLTSEQVAFFDLEAARWTRVLPTREGAARMPVHTRGRIASVPYRTTSASRAHAMRLVNGKIHVAHGTLGLRSIDISTGRVVAKNGLGLVQATGHLSKAIEIDALAEDAAVLIENVTVIPRGDRHVRPFNGIVRYGLNSNTVKGRSEVSWQFNGVLSRARARISGQRLLVNNSGVFQIYDLSEIGRSAEVVASHLVTGGAGTLPLPLDGSWRRGPEVDWSAQFASWRETPLMGSELVGEFLVDRTHLYGCRKRIERSTEAGGAEAPRVEAFSIPLDSWDR